MTGEPTTLSCSFLFMCSGYYRYDQGHRPDFPGARGFRRAGAAPAAVARGPRHARPAHRGDRQRRDRRHPRPGAGRDGRARHHAATIAHATSRPCPRATTASTGSRPSGAPTGGLVRLALAGHQPALISYRISRRRPEVMKSILRHQAKKRAARRLRRRPALRSDLRPVGPAPVHRPGRRPVHRHPRKPGRRGHRHRGRLHRDRHPTRLRRRAAR